MSADTPPDAPECPPRDPAALDLSAPPRPPKPCSKRLTSPGGHTGWCLEVDDHVGPCRGVMASPDPNPPTFMPRKP